MTLRDMLIDTFKKHLKTFLAVKVFEILSCKQRFLLCSGGRISNLCAKSFDFLLCRRNIRHTDRHFCFLQGYGMYVFQFSIRKSICFRLGKTKGKITDKGVLLLNWTKKVDHLNLVLR